jgi:Mn2+/Fe2+ NRAMP family transporter
MDKGYVGILITIIGTTIAPWMQFYQQSSIADKGLKPSDYAYERLDVVLGSLFAIGVAVFITLSCAATLNAAGVRIQDAKDAALALRSLAGRYASTLFALGLLNASLFSAAILPLSTAYVVCEAFGWELGVSRKIREAPVFFGIYTAFIVIGAGIILLPIRSLVQTMIVSQTLNGILLPFILVVMLILVNDKTLLGEKFVNRRVLNGISIVVIAAIILLTLLLAVTSIAQP